MSVGILKLRLLMPENSSLKDKRRIVKSITTRVRDKFNVSISEIEDQDVWQIATLGIACISGDGRFAQETLVRVRDFILDSRFEAHILDEEMEVLPGP